MSDITKFHFNIVRNSPVSIYLQFKSQMQANIRTLRLPVNSRLPDIKSLANAAGIGVKTAFMGLDELVRDDICFRRPKKGTFVGEDQEKSRIERKKICAIYQNISQHDIERDTMLMQIYHGIRQTCHDKNIDLMNLSKDPVDAIEFYTEQKNIEFLGVIVTAMRDYHECIRLAQIFPELKFVYINDYTQDFENTPRNIQ